MLDILMFIYIHIISYYYLYMFVQYVLLDKTLFRKMELSFVIWIIVLGSGYIAFPFAKVFLAVFNKLIE
jgi:hypothetical protein